MISSKIFAVAVVLCIGVGSIAKAQQGLYGYPGGYKKVGFNQPVAYGGQGQILNTSAGYYGQQRVETCCPVAIAQPRVIVGVSCVGPRQQCFAPPPCAEVRVCEPACNEGFVACAPCPREFVLKVCYRENGRWLLLSQSPYQPICAHWIFQRKICPEQVVCAPPCEPSPILFGIHISIGGRR